MKTRFICISLALLLTACSGSSVKDTLGINRSAPDEFRVLSRPPLSVPPQFNLRPPGENAQSPIAKPADKEAQSIVLGAPVEDSPNRFKLSAPAPTDVPATKDVAGTKNKSGPSAESQLLRNAGADKADPQVRSSLVEEKAGKETQEEEASWYNFWDKAAEKKEPMVNAKGEADRIKQNTDQGKPVTEGETPQTKGKDTGVLGNIFGY